MSKKANKTLQELVEKASQDQKDGIYKALLIEGSHLIHILNSKENRKLLAKLADSC